MKNKDKSRATIYGLAAVYLLYLAIKMFSERNIGDESNFIRMLVFAIIFVIAAVGLLIFSFVILKRCADEKKKLTEKKDEVEETEKIL